jgi:hypothetical protein
MASRTVRLLGLPIDDKRGAVEIFLRLRLPTLLWSHRPHEIDPLLHTADQMDRAHVAGIDEMFAGQVAAVGEMTLHHRGHLIVGDGGIGRLHVDNRRRELVVARLSEMDLVAGPFGLALLAAAGLNVVGRANQRGGRGQFLRRAPRQLALLDGELLLPHLAQRLHRGDLAQPLRPGRPGRPGRADAEQ